MARLRRLPLRGIAAAPARWRCIRGDGLQHRAPPPGSHHAWRRHSCIEHSRCRHRCLLAAGHPPLVDPRHRDRDGVGDFPERVRTMRHRCLRTATSAPGASDPVDRRSAGTRLHRKRGASHPGHRRGGVRGRCVRFERGLPRMYRTAAGVRRARRDVFESGGMRHLDSTALHVRAAFERATAPDAGRP